MNSEQDARYRLDLATKHKEQAERLFSQREWVACVDDCQKAVENADKAAIACLRPVPRTHQPDRVLSDILMTVPLTPEVLDAGWTLIVHADRLGPEVHVKLTYGDEDTHTTPWQLFGEPQAADSLRRATEAVECARLIVEHFYPPLPTP